MGYYSGKLIIHNETKEYNLDNYKEPGHVLTLKLSVNFNNNKLFLSNTFVNQLFESKALKDFVINEANKYIDENIEAFNNCIKKICFIETNPNVIISIIGKFLFIKVYCGRNHTKEDCVKAIKRKLFNTKTKEDILRGK